MSVKLRQRLEEITNNELVANHANLFAKLNEQAIKLVHRIEVIKVPAANELYSCIPYATGLFDSRLYQKIAELDHEFAPVSLTPRATPFFANTAYLKHLIKTVPLVSVRREKASVGHWAVYSRYKMIKHIAILVSKSRLQSKWGRGLLVEHDLWEVPESYGRGIRYFEPISRDVALLAFLEFLKQQPRYAAFKQFCGSRGVKLD